MTVPAGRPARWQVIEAILPTHPEVAVLRPVDAPSARRAMSDAPSKVAV
ncbi:hypothetical protein SAMN05216410_0309 [Sanguibacter gelidistatuariae]|uniref:Uncharacterized protein n=1 Tax=Sanguibacter gelidistatuariae TaxID=1814289 RepID=A0A1G6GNI2_9MICO|nr:hypothetical protein SAMN05216410_0309 [Sanguibacter gelidistatuariae]